MCICSAQACVSDAALSAGRWLLRGALSEWELTDWGAHSFPNWAHSSLCLVDLLLGDYPLHPDRHHCLPSWVPSFPICGVEIMRGALGVEPEGEMTGAGLLSFASLPGLSFSVCAASFPQQSCSWGQAAVSSPPLHPAPARRAGTGRRPVVFPEGPLEALSCSRPAQPPNTLPQPCFLQPPGSHERAQGMTGLDLRGPSGLSPLG